MKTLTIIRHAKSDWSYDLPDHDRPLNKRGISDLPKVAARLNQLDCTPEVCFHSSAKRATQTANGLLDYMDSNATRHRMERLYTFDVADLILFILQIDNTHNNVMLVGHNPGFTDLVNVLSDIKLDNLPTCGFAQFTFNIENWKDIKSAKGDLMFLEYPKMI